MHLDAFPVAGPVVYSCVKSVHYEYILLSDKKTHRKQKSHRNGRAFFRKGKRADQQDLIETAKYQ